MADLIQAYETYLASEKNASPNTVCSYMRDIRQFSGWLESHTGSHVLSVVQA
jgi:integrase/recombinase XerD